MTDFLGDYGGYVSRAETGFNELGIQTSELVQSDMLNIECATDERYERLKAELLSSAKMLSEIEHNGRLISIFEMETPLDAGTWTIPHVELLAPKPTRENIDGIDGVFFVTAVRLGSFLAKHKVVKFERKGLANKTNPYVELKGDDWAVKFHDRHIGAVTEIEETFEQQLSLPPNYGGHVTL